MAKHVPLTRVAGAALAIALTSPFAATADPLAQPSLGATISGNSNPFSVDAGPLGKVYVSGVVSALGMVQSNPVPGDRTDQFDLSNGQVFIQTTSGPVQIFVDAGLYSMPALGTSYVHATTFTSNTYSGLPMAYVKLQPTSEFSIQIGKLPSLIGAESSFTFQNINIERGLLWNQEPVFSDGIQLNYSKGKVSVSASLNDGFYSNRYNWLSGSFAYTVSPKDTVTVAGGGALSRYDRATFATPLFQNNSDIIDVIWAHTDGPWMLQPYFQYTHATSVESQGIAYPGADTWSGAILAKYSFNKLWSLAARVEYVSSSSAGCSIEASDCIRTSLLYGPGSKAVSVTLTPTFQKGVFFVRAEASYVGITGGTPGAEFGRAGEAGSQFRGLLETGVLF